MAERGPPAGEPSPSQNSSPNAPGAQTLASAADRVRESGVFGRPGLISRLFDFLLEQTLASRAPKEIEIAVEVFGKNPQFEVSQDAVVRVYVHKLRRKLDEYYAGTGSTETHRITIPRGQYKLILEPTGSLAEAGVALTSAANAETTEITPSLLPADAAHSSLLASPPSTSSAQAQAKARRFPVWSSGLLVAVLALSLIANVVLGLWVRSARTDGPSAAVREARQSSVWAPLFADDLPIYVVVGDYYIFAEWDEAKGGVQRLIRDFDINSMGDLEDYLVANPALANKYRNLNLQYLPTGLAFALKDLLPVLQSGHKAVHVVLASDLDTDMLKTAHIVYVGYLSAMGMLRDPVFSSSRYNIGDTYDELDDRKNGQRYFSQAADPDPGIRFHDYSYFSTFIGPAHNRIMVVAGMRDTGLMHMAAALTSRTDLAELSRRTQSMPQFEALYEAYGINHAELGGKLVMTGPVDTSKTWSAN